MDRLGQFALALGLALALYGLVASVAGARRGRPVLVESARTTAYSLLAAVVAANAAMLAAILAIHPPMLYLGFIGFTVPFAVAMAALITGRLSDRWIRITRRWTLAAWVFLTIGLVLGALWSYGVLGWGGYWAWDPVENVALLPWLMSTAFLHSVIIQERRGMLKVWNLSLI